MVHYKRSRRVVSLIILNGIILMLLPNFGLPASLDSKVVIVLGLVCVTLAIILRIDLTHQEQIIDKLEKRAEDGK
ncbi:MAG: hypothetical protein COV07_03425 [Candidatus Vogelbacteria bacterium CG10_big_fil_rev_8_21_14_0_10_45_14]|uniref:Uncharacterized protein n=1 Tax=Candidatus Vogelbacteria bacterium CG10_big_fil_rev_8_21_14_0_10_45_14 TaxID=1975042 RepID=A0A2H0RJ93_9BACT|nr:MAG: hypothetical protein COV07_03425 [Candidatus Vogelbacteria bacterium CG10_big_fil_rev_8_21_14_0_10_45_14]